MKTADLDAWIVSRAKVPNALTRAEERISLAANLALENGYIEGVAQKQWLVTQMLLILLDESEEYMLGDEWDQGIAP